MSSNYSLPPPPPPPPRHRHRLSSTLIIPPLIAAAVTISLLLLLFFFLWRRLLRLRRPSLTASGDHPRRFSYSELRRATASFSPSRRLGQGGFGAVYSGTLGLTPVAVKVMDAGSLQGEREFRNEVFLADKMVDSDRVVKLLGFASSRKRRRMCLVYELMPNGNLQDCLMHRKCEELMDWSNRFRIAIEVARALAYLHHHCNPPVIHGDVKPSNILLDANFSAKISDFGLARLKLVDQKDRNNEVVVHITENEAVLDNDHVNFVGVGAEDYGSVMELETESMTTTVGIDEGVEQSPVRIVLPVETSPEMVTALASPSDFHENKSDLEGQLDRISVENSLKEVGKDKLLGKMKVKDYVVEWIGKEVGKNRPIGGGGRGGWIDEAPPPPSSSMVAEKVKKNQGKKMLDWWVSMEDRKISKKDKRKPVREWWKEEYCEELSKKHKKKNKKNKTHERTTMSDSEEHNWWPRDDQMHLDRKKRRTNSKGSSDWWLDRRHTGSDISGEIPKSSGLSISSTPSMRGTVCYVAPEYTIGGDLSEKCDVYSYGVLLLVIIAGRRPLQVSGSPMSEFHRANLISWTRQLARYGKLLDLVDKKIHSLNDEEARLCILVALVCLQKSPVRRPSMKEVVGMLTGELDPPQLPTEYRSFKSRKKFR